MKIGIVGAGISGVTTAYFLSKNNVEDIEIIESRRYPAMATSYANGGQLSASNSDAWNSWENVFSGLKGIFKQDSPVLINPKVSLHKILWFYHFFKNIKNNSQITSQICKMANESVLLYKEISDKESIEFDLLEKGILHFYFNDKDTKKALQINKLYSAAGLKRKRITHEELYHLEPSLKGKKFNSIFYTPSDKTGDIHKFCNNLTNKLIKNKKIKLINREIKSLKDIEKNYDKIIICAGINSRRLAMSIGERLQIYPVKGYSITINNPGKCAPYVSLLDDKRKIVTSRLGNRLRIAGTAEFNGYNLDIIQKRVRPLIRWSTEMFPDINTHDIKPWAGLRPMTPNMLPIVRRSNRIKKVFYNTGHGHLGWTLSAYTGKVIAEEIFNN